MRCQAPPRIPRAITTLLAIRTACFLNFIYELTPLAAVPTIAFLFWRSLSMFDCQAASCNRAAMLISLPLLLICVASAQNTQPAGQSSHDEVLIKNAYLMTVTHGNIKNGSLHIKSGKIAAVGANVSAPASALVIDAGGKYVTPGVVDAHSHTALDGDVNEATSPVTPQMKMEDAFNYQDKAIYRSLAGGVTTSLVLHGSANMIGGQALVMKHKYGASRDAMIFPNAPPSIKFASGE